MPRHKTATEQQRRGCILKVEDGMNDSQISREVGLSPQAVGRWWKMAHVKRELARQTERYRGDTLPNLIKNFAEIREQTVKKLRTMLEGEMTIREATTIIKTMTEALDSEFDKLESVRIAAEDTGGKDMLDFLEPEEIHALAVRGAAKEGPGFQRDKHKRLRLVDPVLEIPEATMIEDDDNVIEAEYTEEERN